MLTRFARAHQITFPMLSDKGSAVIRRYGILNTNIPPTHTFYGIPFPGEFLVAPDGRVARAMQVAAESRGSYSWDCPLATRATIREPRIIAP